MFVFGDILLPRTYAEIKNCEFSARIDEIPVIVKFYLSTSTHSDLPTLTLIPADTPAENFLVKGEIESDFKMNWTKFVKRNTEMA